MPCHFLGKDHIFPNSNSDHPLKINDTGLGFFFKAGAKQRKERSVGLCICQPLESSDDKPAKDICCKTSNCNNTRT